MGTSARIRALEAATPSAGSVAGTVEAGKSIVVDSNKDASYLRNLGVTNLDAGKSGTAGSVDVFAGTAAKGKLSVVAADNAGNTVTTITNASQAGTRAYTIPDAGADASFAMTEGAQTLNGVKTFGSMFRIPRATVAATGTNLSNAAQLATGFTSVTGADATKGVKLPATPTAGDMVIIKNTAAAVLKVWPDAAATINGIAANAHIPIAASVGAIFIADSATQWYTIPLLPS